MHFSALNLLNFHCCSYLVDEAPRTENAIKAENTEQCYRIRNQEDGRIWTNMVT